MRSSNRLLWFFALAFGIAWTGVLITSTRESHFVAMLLGPSVAAIVMTGVVRRARGLRRFAQRLLRWPADHRWYATLLLAPLTLLGVVITLSLASPAFLPGIWTGEAVGATLLMTLIGGLGAGFFEELGWTAYATPRLLRRYSWFGTGVVLGLPWALWHMLPDYVASTMPLGLWFVHAAEWFIALTAFRIFMTWVYTRTRSLPLAMLLHASFTGSQLLLWPAAGAPNVELIWYGVFAIDLALIATAVPLASQVLSSVAASRAERTRPLLGDTLVPDPMFSVTHAITIDSSPEAVWPWLQQMGSDRAGWYSYDRIDNAGHASSDRLLAVHQDVKTGDVMPALPGASNSFVVTAVEPGRDLLLTVPGNDGPIVTWEHFLEPQPDGRTRLIVRGRAARSWKQMAREADTSGQPRRGIELGYRVISHLPDPIMVGLARVGHRMMEARHMRGIKRRVEAVVDRPAS